MRIRLFASACSLFASIAFAAPAVTNAPAAQMPSSVMRIDAPKTAAAKRALSLRSLAADVDSRVLANLLTDSIPRGTGGVVTVSPGEITRCDAGTCHVPLNVKVSNAAGPVSLSFAVASERGLLSDVHHAECGNGTCTVDLVLEKGRNTLSVGALDGIAQATSFRVLTVNTILNPAIASNPKTEWF